MDVITQTNRTILFEEINPEKNDLLRKPGKRFVDDEETYCYNEGNELTKRRSLSAVTSYLYDENGMCIILLSTTEVMKADWSRIW